MTDRQISWFHGWRLVVLLYVGLLALSHLVRYFQPDSHDPESNQETVTVQQVRADSVLPDRTTQIAYRNEYRGREEHPPVILLLHGSPVGVPFLPELIDELSKQNRVIAPDLPGYDASDREIPDYSMQAFSLYMNQMLDSLSVDQVHVVGYSLGSGVALQMVHRFPQKIASIDMLSGLGVQELELLGSYHLNHTVHGGQLFLMWLLHEAVPHFGLLHDFPLNVPYARSFYDSDQRPLRDYLKQYKKPMLIQHGREDGLVPLAAAKEHHRLVPQSKLILYEGGHAIVKSHAEELTSDINQFIQRVESGEALTYDEAPKERITEAEKPFKEVDFAKAEGLTLYIMMLIIVFSTFVSEDLTCIGAGLLAARGIIGFFPATLACFIGIIIGDFAIFLMGRWIGKPAVRRAPIKWFVSEQDLEQSSDWFKVRGPMIIIGSRFVPGSRFPTYFSAGMIGMPMYIFASYFLLAGIVWTPLLVGLAMLVGTELLRYFQVYQAYALWVIPFIILLLFLFVKFILPAVTWRGRRMVLSRWRRLTRWEYWSPFIIYTPVVAYIFYLWLKFGRLTSFTAVNPGIPHGGFINESKTEIFKSLNSCQGIPQYDKIPASLNDWEKFIRAREFIQNKSLDYPVTLKPDAGQRGTGVAFPGSEDALKNALEEIDHDMILQEYVEGEEFGIFYYRYPDQEQGQILSITQKRLPTLVGDGKHTLEELILQDDRAVALAKIHFKEHQDHLFEVPEEGEEIRLVTLGTHARGAQFYDATHLTTEKLVEAIDEIASHFEGFYFGRLDLRVPSEQDLKDGRNIKVLEVNGVTSETTIIYDQKYSFIQAQKKLMQQWKLAFEIGEMNRQRGHKTSSLYSLIQSVINYRNK
ncbi:alpha/beta fold hydrolase [Aliifodinibius sp. S!AR15-10]|uniref:alpha/beta fold hydrolase n=1 Tax=Aliifodinibius sp. S!AR15-10 TaxID=2950437 RepID=UPI0028679D34|nr:alpha/beta fold hydrolase [Aliifodinibius sp. S!AR15-10]MDR8391627.1 alpha/beta fold hydrolase [Aliifodinibius sp. S!AR15-10]